MQRLSSHSTCCEEREGTSARDPSVNLVPRIVMLVSGRRDANHVPYRSFVALLRLVFVSREIVQ